MQLEFKTYCIMNLKKTYLPLLSLAVSFCNTTHQNLKRNNNHLKDYSKIEMNLSAFGVESDGFPYIRAIIDFKNDSSLCERWYDNPIYKDSSYSFTKADKTSILSLLLNTDIKGMQKGYKAAMTDQATSTMTIYTNHDTVQFKDYGLIGPSPLKDIYKLVYKLNINFR